MLNDRYQLIHGDACEVLSQLPSNSVDCCVTSPPYYALRDYGYDGQIGLEQTPEEYIDRLVKVFREMRRVLKPEGTCWVNIGDSYCGTGSKGEYKDPKYADGRNGQVVSLTQKVDGCKKKDLIGIPWMLAFALRKDGWYLRQDIIWAKQNPMPESITDRCTKSHEYIFLLTKSARYFFDHKAIQEDAISKDSRPSALCRAREKNYMTKERLNPEAYRKIAHPIGGTKRQSENDEHYRTSCGNEYMFTGKRNKRDVWVVQSQPFNEAHFAVYPEKLVEPCILAGCPQGGVVLDMFNGSGTTGVVALKHGRKYIGIDMNEEYIAMATRRIEQETAQVNINDIIQGGYNNGRF